LRLKVAFVGFTGTRARRITDALEQASVLSLETTVIRESKANATELAGAFGAVFMSTELGTKRLAGLVGELRGANSHMPIILTYGTEPDGKVFELARTQDCWLFSELDGLKRGLTADEIARELEARSEASELGSRLMDISLVSGPCSTGD